MKRRFPKSTIYFLGFLANVGPAIRKIQLEQGFKIKRFTYQKVSPILSYFERRHLIDAPKLWDRDYLVPGRRTYCYCVTNSLDEKAKRNGQGGVGIPLAAIKRFHKERVEEYLL